MSKKSWAKGRKDPTRLVRVDPDVYEISKQEADKDKMTLKDWVSSVIRRELIKRELIP